VSGLLRALAGGGASDRRLWLHGGLPARRQFFKGWTFLLLKRHATELWQLDTTERAQLIEEVSRVAQALSRAFGAAKMNYELLGNAIAHIHWHLVPRRADDPSPQAPVWTVAHEPVRLTPGEMVERVELIRSHLGG
jgi:diadenosine tetraphosphate (Ap4A) HIT family hydrolase